jgi:hypothetical protein
MNKKLLISNINIKQVNRFNIFKVSSKFILYLSVE